MKKIRNAEELKEAIAELEIRRADELRAIKDQVAVIKESLKPANLVKTAVKKAVTTPSIRGKIVTSVVGVVAGYLAKKFLVGASKHPLRKIVGSLLQMGVTGGVHGIRSAGTGLVKRFFKKRGNGIAID